MRKVSVAAVVVAVLSLSVSAWLLLRYDPETGTRGGPSATALPGAVTTVPLVVVPAEIGRNAYGAADDLKAVGLGFKISRAPSVSLAKGLVMSQNPEQGTKVPQGTVVELTLSSGPP